MSRIKAHETIPGPTDSWHDTSSPSRADLVRVTEALDHLKEWIPSQGPIGVFVHHNTLHHFEHLNFEEAVETVGMRLGAAPYLRHEEYLKAWSCGRIRDEDVTRAVRDDCKNNPAIWRTEVVTRENFYTFALRIPWTYHTRESLLWSQQGLPALKDILERLQKIPIADLDRRRQGSVPQSSPSDGPLQMAGHDWRSSLTPDEREQINRWTVTIIAAYLDQGVARWPMPRDPNAGLWSNVRSLFWTGGGWPAADLAWPESLRDFWSKGASHAISVDEWIVNLLRLLKIPEGHWSEFILKVHQDVASWAGLVQVLEEGPALFPGEIRSVTLSELVALRLALYVVVQSTRFKNDQMFKDTPEGIVDRPRQSPTRDTLLPTIAGQILALSSIMTPGADAIKGWTDEDLTSLAFAFWDFDDVRRRRVLHQAFERSFQIRILNGIRSLRKETPHEKNSPVPSPAVTGTATLPAFQIAFCIDEREESLRRHLEDVCPAVETFGAAGFFGVAMAFQGAHEGRPVPLCPVLVKPQHLVIEETPQDEGPLWEKGVKKMSQSLSKHIHTRGLSLIWGQLTHMVAGSWGALEMAVRIARPRLAKRISDWTLSRGVKDRTTLRYERASDQDQPIPSLLGSLSPGFSVMEMADRIANLLKTIGLTTNFSRVVILMGHGSTTNNNPFASAYECGACGGRRGEHNPRLFAAMANRPDVRALLGERGISISPETIFVGGCHDTCADTVDYFDLAQVPESHQGELKSIRESIKTALEKNAHERCRRFANAIHLSPKEALRHVSERSFNMREPRPEYGHGSNAACIIGRRQSTRGLFLDRRSFLVSYDPLSDESGKILEGILGAVMPVCAGISLEYYFSRVDNRRYGAGTKLPHNVVGMMGVMDGLSSDLRTGLPWQTVEIHEPMRLFTVIEAPLARIRKVVARLPYVANLLAHRWIHLAYFDPLDGTMGWVTPDGEELLESPLFDREEPTPVVSDSQAYYRGISEHLPPAIIKGFRPNLGERGPQ